MSPWDSHHRHKWNVLICQIHCKYYSLLYHNKQELYVHTSAVQPPHIVYSWNFHSSHLYSWEHLIHFSLMVCRWMAFFQWFWNVVINFTHTNWLSLCSSFIYAKVFRAANDEIFSPAGPSALQVHLTKFSVLFSCPRHLNSSGGSSQPTFLSFSEQISNVFTGPGLGRQHVSDFSRP